MPSVTEAIASRNISLLKADLKTRTFMAVREAMEEAINALNIGAKLLARRSNVMMDILLATEKVARNIRLRCSHYQDIHLQTEYIGTRETRITLHEVPMYINEDHLTAFFLD